MKVVILCGGLGTRLREETEFRPKPLVEVGGRPILWHILKLYAHHGFNEFILCLGYRGQMIREYFLGYEAMNNDFTIRLGDTRRITYHGAHDEQDFEVTLADTGRETMTGGRVARVARYVDADTFMVTYGDGIGDINVRKLLEFHRAHGRLATITTVHPESRFGVLDVEGGGRVRKFAEKPRLEGQVSAGFFVFQRDVFDWLTGDECVLEGEPMMRLADADQLRAYGHEGCWYPMDTYRDAQLLNELWDSGRAPWKVWA